MTSGNHQNYSIIENGQNTEKSPGDLRRLAVTQTLVKDHQLTLMWKTFKKKKKKGFRGEGGGWRLGKIIIWFSNSKFIDSQISDVYLTFLILKYFKPGDDGIHGFWFKKFTSIHDRQALETNKCLQTAHVLEWMTKGRTTLIQKDPNKGTAPNSYSPITCLPMMWKILTAEIREEIYYSL